MILIAILFKNFDLADDKIEWILLMFFSPLYLSNPKVTSSNSFHRALVATMIVILSYIFLFGMIVALGCLTKTPILEKWLVTHLLNLFDLLTFEYIRRSWKIKLTTSILTWKYTNLSFSHMYCKLSMLIILWNKSLLTPLYMILIAIPITIWLFFL